MCGVLISCVFFRLHSLYSLISSLYSVVSVGVWLHYQEIKSVLYILLKNCLPTYGFPLYYKTTNRNLFILKQKHGYWHQNRYIGQGSRIQSPEENLCLSLPQLIYHKGGKNIQPIKPVSLINSAGKTGQVHAKNKARLLSYAMWKNKLKMDQNHKINTIKSQLQLGSSSPGLVASSRHRLLDAGLWAHRGPGGGGTEKQKGSWAWVSGRAGSGRAYSPAGGGHGGKDGHLEEESLAVSPGLRHSLMLRLGV